MPPLTPSLLSHCSLRSRPQDKCEDLIEDVGDVTEANEELSSAMDDLCTGYVELAVLATKLAAKSVMLDLTDPPILQLVCTSKWEEGEELVSVACKTLKDWFGDLSMWLPEYVRAAKTRGVRLN